MAFAVFKALSSRHYDQFQNMLVPQMEPCTCAALLAPGTTRLLPAPVGLLFWMFLITGPLRGRGASVSGLCRGVFRVHSPWGALATVCDFCAVKQPSEELEGLGVEESLWGQSVAGRCPQCYRTEGEEAGGPGPQGPQGVFRVLGVGRGLYSFHERPRGCPKPHVESSAKPFYSILGGFFGFCFCKTM